MGVGVVWGLGLVGDIILCMGIKGNNHLLMPNTVCYTKQIPKITKVIIP